MTDAGIDAALLLHPRDVLYYAGTARPAALLVTPQRGQTAHRSSDAVLFVRRGIAYAREEATVERVEDMRGFASITDVFAELGLASGALGTELDVISAHLCQRLEEAFPAWDIVDVSPIVLEQRAVKDEDELVATRSAATAADLGHNVVPQVARAGMTELALAAQVEEAMRLAGHEGYQPLRHPEARGGGVLLMSGENLSVRGGHGLVVTGVGLSPATPYGASRRQLEPGDLVVVDIGSTCGGYTADESRTFVIGQATDAQRELFAVAQRAEEAVLERLRPGAPVAKLYAAAEAVVDGGAAPPFPPGSLTLPGFVGHGIGLELDEPPLLWPRDEACLREGMVLAIEIEVSAPGQSTMVKLEDTVAVRPDGHEVLTHVPRELIECG